ncbi:glutaredoxin domain-containing protein [Vibrio phage vB_VcorM_GR11A]|nr:glutaredoxin domain-containing protein [Vibrio phage vB_VcorM_GR11A]
MEQQNKIVMYSKDNCPQCDNAKAILAKQGLDVEVKKLGVDFEREFMLSRFPAARSYPQFDLNDKPVGTLVDLSGAL